MNRLFVSYVRSHNMPEYVLALLIPRTPLLIADCFIWLFFSPLDNAIDSIVTQIKCVRFRADLQHST